MMKIQDLLVRFAFALVLFGSGVQALAQVELPPVLTTPEAKTEYMNRIRKAVPEIVGTTDNGQAGNTNYFFTLIQLEQNLVNTLRADSEYMTLASVRPALQ